MTRPTAARSGGARAVVRVGVALGVALAYVTGAPFERVVSAQEAAPSRRVVEVLIAGGGPDAAPLEETVRELLSRLTLVMESQTVGHIDAEEAAFRSTSRPSLLARVGVDLRVKDVATVTVVDGRTGDVTLRRTVRRDGPSAVVREELAHVVQAAVDPMLLAERDRAAASPPPPPPPREPVAAPVPTPGPAADAPPPRDVAQTSPEASRSPFALDLSTMAGAGSYASGAGAVARAGGGAALVWRRGLRPSVGLAAHYLFPFETGSDVALAHVGVASFRGAAALEVYGNASFALDVAAGGGLDVLRVEPRSNVLPADRLGATTHRVDPVASTAVTGHLAIGAGTALSLLVGADIDLTSRRWVVEGTAQRVEAFAPWRVRPMVMLGFTFTALGEGRFAAREAAR